MQPEIHRRRAALCVGTKNIELFEEFGIFSEAEVRARYEVSLENYTKALHIEALTMLDMAKNRSSRR